LTAPTEHRIAAVDVDGDTVVYGTALTSYCPFDNVCPPSFCPDFACTVADTESVHSLSAVSTDGSNPHVLVSGLRGVTEIAHDDTWIYWVEPSSDLDGQTSNDGRLWRIDRSGSTEVVAFGLTISFRNQHPFVMAEDAIYVNTGGQ